VHLHERGTSLPGIGLRWQIQESLHIEAVKTLERHFLRLAQAGPLRGETGEPPFRSAGGRQVINVAAIRFSGAREHKGVACGRRIEAAEHAVEIADARGSSAARGHGPDLMRAALLIDEIEPLAVRGPERAVSIRRDVLFHRHLRR
jgi:hypothetical protein